MGLLVLMALFSGKSYTSRSRFNRKVTDSVVLDRGFNVVAIAELDDSSHRDHEQEDAERDAMLAEADYTGNWLYPHAGSTAVKSGFRGLG